MDRDGRSGLLRLYLRDVLVKQEAVYVDEGLAQVHTAPRRFGIVIWIPILDKKKGPAQKNS